MPYADYVHGALKQRGSICYESSQMYFGSLSVVVAYRDEYLRRNDKLWHILWSNLNTGCFIPLYSVCMDLSQSLSGDWEQEYCVRAVCAVLFCAEK